MKRQSQFHSLKSRKSQAGISLIETTMALGLLLVVSAGILGLGAIALSTTENQGHLAARTAEYAQDKMEQLLALRYGDTKDRKSTRLNSSHRTISYAVFCLKKKKK